MTRVTLDEKDANKVLRVVMYGSRKHPRKLVLFCLCGNRSEDIRENPKAWNGWQVLPVSKCPECISKKVNK